MRYGRLFLPLALIAPLVWVAGWLPEPLPGKNLPDMKPQIVVSSQIIPDQSIAILLTKTFGALDASDDSELITHTSIAQLLDVSPVTNPAYVGTDVALRAKNPGAAPAKRPVRLIRARALLLLNGATK